MNSPMASRSHGYNKLGPQREISDLAYRASDSHNVLGARIVGAENSILVSKDLDQSVKFSEIKPWRLSRPRMAVAHENVKFRPVVARYSWEFGEQIGALVELMGNSRFFTKTVVPPHQEPDDVRLVSPRDSLVLEALAPDP